MSSLKRQTDLPIGNLTSQVLANLYLSDLEHFIKEKLPASAYLRYVDDLILLSDDKQQLWSWRDAITEEMEGFICDCTHGKNLFQTRLGVDVLGYSVFLHYRLLRNDNGHRFAQTGYKNTGIKKACNENVLQAF